MSVSWGFFLLRILHAVPEQIASASVEALAAIFRNALRNDGVTCAL